MLLFGSFGKSTMTRNKRVKLADGTSWDVVRGTHPPTLSSLEEKLAVVKELSKKLEPACGENSIPSKPTITKLGVVSTDQGPRRHGIFDATQFGRATRSDRKAN